MIENVMIVVVSFTLVALWHGSGEARLALQEGALETYRPRIRLALRWLFWVPVALLAAIVLVSRFVDDAAAVTRLAHGLFAIGLWMAGALFTLMLVALWNGRHSRVLALIGWALTAPAALCFTPSPLYQLLLPAAGNGLPLVMGAILMSVCYGALFSMRRSLRPVDSLA